MERFLALSMVELFLSSFPTKQSQKCAAKKRHNAVLVKGIMSLVQLGDGGLRVDLSVFESVATSSYLQESNKEIIVERAIDHA